MKKLLVIVLILALVLSIAVGCMKTELPGEETQKEEPAKKEEKVEETAKEVSIDDLEKADKIKINFAMGNNARTLTYQQSTPLELPDGTVISQGDLKATWQHIQKETGINFEDVAVQDQIATEMIDIASATSFSDAVVYGGQRVAGRLMDLGSQGYFINIKDYLDYMPDLKAYLEANPNVAKAITAYDGGIYHLPYVAEMNNFARGFAARKDWVEALLDSEDALEKESHSLTVAYEGYWDRNATNVVDLQNDAAAGGKLTQEIALTTLKDYIAATYPNLTKPSELYIGENAQYDMDELVALLRVVELSPNTLSKVTTGSVVKGAKITPYFVRRTKDRGDLLRLVTYFGGQRAYASDSYSARLFMDVDGEMKYSYAEPEFLEKVEFLKQMYSEGLISSEFSDLSMKDNFRSGLFFSDDAEGQQQFGFMTMDWFGSTTAGSDKIFGILPPVTTIEKAGITDFVHYVENTRVIKDDGWAISSSATEEEINAALVLFNYFYTAEGNNVQNYSIPEAREDGEKFIGADGTEYPKFNQWIKDTAGEYKNGDLAGFLRDFMGSHLPVGYPKNIGFELQYTSENGFAMWEMYNNAGVLNMSYGSENDYLRLMPPLISINEQEAAKVANTSIGEEQSDQLYLYITGSESSLGSVEEIAQMYKDAGIEEYIAVYQKAYERMMAN